MSERVIVTMDFGNYLTPNVRASHAAAAERWNASYRVMKYRWGKRRDIFGAKMELHKLPVPRGTHVLWLDGDVLVRADCPNIFELAKPTEFAGVCCSTHDDDDDLATFTKQWWDAALEFMGVGDIPYEHGTYINGGVLLFGLPEHEDVWANSEHLVYNIPLHRAIGPMVEQTMMNVQLRALEIPVKLLDPAFNTLGRVAWESPGPAMETYVYHLAAYRDYRHEQRNDRLAELDWRITP